MSTEDRIKSFIGSADTEPRANESEWNDFARRAHGTLYTRRAAAALGTVALVGAVAFAAVSLRPSDGPAPLLPATTPSATPEPSPSASAGPARIVVPTEEHELWYVGAEKLSWTATVTGGPVKADVPPDDPIAQLAAFWLGFQVGEPLGAVQEVGETTAIPAGTEVLAAYREGDVLFVDLSSEFESGGGSLSMQLRVAQIVYTATQFDGVESVRILIEGQEVEAIGGEGLIVSTPLTRRDFQDVAPNIVVEQPRPGQEFSPGDSASGFANVFEANVSFMVLDKDGKELELTTPFTTATCGSGCWGDFTHVLEFPLTEPQEGRIVVLTYSAEDGSPQDEIHIPVMLVP